MTSKFNLFDSFKTHKCILLFLGILSVSPIYSQDIKKIIQRKKDSQIVEEYFVLKSDKSIKSGNYLKYSIRLAIQKYIQEFGSFNNNKKDGVWFYFNTYHPQNPLSIIGEFTDGQRTGRWAYFYPNELKDSTALYLLGIIKSAEIISSKRSLQVSIDTTGLKLAAVGYFDNNKKVGRWTYYSKEGELVKIYDFSTKKEVYSFSNDSINLYLRGGFSRFQDEFLQNMFDDVNELKSLQPSDASFEIITNDGNLYINRLTPIIDNPFAAYFEDIVKNMPLYWTEFDPIFENFSFIINLRFSKIEQGSSLKFVSINPKFDKKKQ